MMRSTISVVERLPRMEPTSAGIESELLDLSTVDVANLRSVELTGMTAAIARVRERIADSAASISGFNPSFTSPPEASKPPVGAPDQEDHVA